MRIEKVNVLGTKYKIIWERQGKGLCSKADASGLCGPLAKKIYIEIIEPSELTVGDIEAHMQTTLRHELIHAFLYESGLSCNTERNWARNEEMVDWLAIQWHKIHEVIIKGEKAIE